MKFWKILTFWILFSGDENVGESYKYLTHDDDHLGDDSIPIDVTHDEKHQKDSTLSVRKILFTKRHVYSEMSLEHTGAKIYISSKN